MSSTTWKSSPSSTREGPPRWMLGLRQAGSPEPAHDRGREERSCLQAVQDGEIVAAVEIELLAADHRERRRDELARHCRRVVGQREPDPLHHERVAGQNCGRLPVRSPDARPAAPLGVVVERRQVVVDEREGVHELDRRRSRQQLGQARLRPPPRRPGKARASPASRPARGGSARPATRARASGQARRSRSRRARAAPQAPAASVSAAQAGLP